MAACSNRGTLTSSHARCGRPCLRSRNDAHPIRSAGSGCCREVRGERTLLDLPTLGRAYCLQTHLVCDLLPKDILRNFPRYRHGKPVEEAHVPRYLEPCNLAQAELTDLGNSCLRIGAQDDARAELLAVPCIRD